MCSQGIFKKRFEEDGLIEKILICMSKPSSMRTVGMRRKSKLKKKGSLSKCNVISDGYLVYI